VHTNPTALILWLAALNLKTLEFQTKLSEFSSNFVCLLFSANTRVYSIYYGPVVVYLAKPGDPIPTDISLGVPSPAVASLVKVVVVDVHLRVKRKYFGIPSVEAQFFHWPGTLGAPGTPLRNTVVD